jgi:hypothetical protein
MEIGAQATCAVGRALWYVDNSSPFGFNSDSSSDVWGTRAEPSFAITTEVTKLLSAEALVHAETGG